MESLIVLFAGRTFVCEKIVAENRIKVVINILVLVCIFVYGIVRPITYNGFKLPVVRLKALVYRKAFNKANCFLDICKMKITFAQRP